VQRNLAGTKQYDRIKKRSSAHIGEGKPRWQLVSCFCFSILNSWTFSSKCLGVSLSELYLHADLGSEVWPQKRQDCMKCCCSGKCQLTKGNLKAVLLYSCTVLSLCREGQINSSECLGKLSRAVRPF